MTDIQLTESQQAAISALMHDEGVIPPPIALARNAYLRNDTVERDRAAKDPDMLRTVWGDHSRYTKYWEQLPGMYAAGDIAVWDADGYPDPVKGERMKAFVVLRRGVEPGPGLVASLKDHVRQDLGPIAQPSEIEVRDVLPKTRSGKIVRRYLKAIELGEDPGDLSTLAD